MHEVFKKRRHCLIKLKNENVPNDIQMTLKKLFYEKKDNIDERMTIF